MPVFGRFPFGEPIREVEQRDRKPKCLFVLGVYASAVHARWVGLDGKQLIQAVGVASEPEIFWKGDGAKDIIARIQIPESAGSLGPPANNLHNGPSGKALDSLYLEPIELSRSDAWLCDLVPHSCLNPSQKQALQRAYSPLVNDGVLPEVAWPTVPSVLADDERRRAIRDEIVESNASTVMLLGDEPIRWFLNHYDDRWSKLSDFGKTPERYGRCHSVRLDDLEVDVLPLVHPRQAAALGFSDPEWRALHVAWTKDCPVMLDC